ncbi:5'-AMP-activated protein kinase-related [Quillaja saponaria]|uniref:5'-AMP-activated protein kinase-related n=1 Tax=Quillaja saponaria TaxID=32244 RepID=A0AAD7KPT4_QUISA|nr:5'-AMP-activated protein kinase-related [Quillaja saponaria]
MLCDTATSSRFLFSHCSVEELKCQPFASAISVVGSRRRSRRLHSTSSNFVAVKETGALLGYPDLFKKGNFYMGLYYRGCSGFVRSCKDWDREGDFSLEAEILEFMKNSKNPEAFPGKKELVDAGRVDLLDAIIKKGGWLSLGWDFNEEEEEAFQANDVRDLNSLVSREFDRVKDESKGTECNEIRASGVVSPFSACQSPSATSSGRSLESVEEDESGIEGILSRLERQRNGSLGFVLSKTGNNVSFPSNGDKDECHSRILTDVTVASLERSSKSSPLSSKSGIFGDIRSKLGQDSFISNVEGSKNSLKSETWRTWSIQRVGFTDADFEAAEISPSETRKEGVTGVSNNEMLDRKEVDSEHMNKEELDSFDELIKHE